jgi:hypothetical protein
MHTAHKIVLVLFVLLLLSCRAKQDGAIEGIIIPPDAMRNKNIALKIQGFIKGYTVVSERELEGGRIEVVLELSLTGPAGLSRYITE